MANGLLVGGILYWLICVGSAVLIARDKRRSRVEGLLYGSLFGLLGTLIELCLPKLREHRTDGENQALAAEFRSQLDQLSAMTGRLVREEVRETPQPQSHD
jgi:hypothetical protein